MLERHTVASRTLQVLYINFSKSLTNQSLRKNIQVGSTVVVRLYDGREVEAKITKIIDSVAGRKVHIAFGVFALVVRETQIIRTRVKSRLRRLGSLSGRHRFSYSLAPQHFERFFRVVDRPVFFAFNGAQEPLFERGASFENPAVHE